MSCRALAEEDYSEDKTRRIASSIEGEAEALYSPGSAAASGLPSLNAWLTKEGCMYPDVMEALVMAHLGKGDQMSAMIASEW